MMKDQDLRGGVNPKDVEMSYNASEEEDFSAESQRTSEDDKADVREMSRKLGALEIILTAPYWPRRDDLSDNGRALCDAMIESAKEYALCVVDENFDQALKILSGWSKLFNSFLDDTHVDGNEAAEKMVGVYRHYADALGIDFNKIEKAA